MVGSCFCKIKIQLLYFPQAFNPHKTESIGSAIEISCVCTWLPYFKRANLYLRNCHLIILTLLKWNVLSGCAAALQSISYYSTSQVFVVRRPTVLWLRRWQVCSVTPVLPTSSQCCVLSSYKMHIHRLNAFSASGKSAPTRVLELPFPLNPTLIVQSSVNLCAPMWRTLLFMPMSKAITAASQKQTIPSRRSHPVIWDAKNDGRG